MGGTIHITPEEQTTLTNALALEQAGFTEASKWLRARVRSLQFIDWDDAKRRTPTDDAAWAALFARHRGSTPPGAQPPRQATAHPQPTPHQPTIRPDQSTAS